MTKSEWYKQWYRKNRAKKIKQVREWRAKNVEKCRSYSTTWNRKNKEYLHQWYLDKKELKNANQAR